MAAARLGKLLPATNQIRRRRCCRQPTEWQRIGNQIDGAMIFARADLVNARVKRAGRSRQRHSVIVKGKRILCPPHYAPPNNDYDPPRIRLRTWFSIDPQPASINPTINISIVFICAFLVDYGRIIRHPAIKNDSSAILSSGAVG